MRIALHAVGRMKAGPEKELADRYFQRLAQAGPSVALEFAGVTELPESRARSASARKSEEAERLRALLMPGTALVLLDEGGRQFGSEDFAARLAAFRDAGQRAVLFAIGGADGHDATLRDAASLVLSLGSMTWPHQFARIMLAEQLYRAATILAGHPYHRG